MVEEELTADHGSSSFNQTLGATQTVKMARETTQLDATCPLEPSGWPKTDAVIEYAKKLEGQEGEGVKQDAKDSEVGDHFFHLNILLTVHVSTSLSFMYLD